jgi:hypothetical protein
MRFRASSINFAASPPRTSSAVTTTKPATHRRLVGGRANITTPNTTSAARTPVRRAGLLAVVAVFGAKVCAKEHYKRLEEL